MKWCYCNRL